MRFPSLPCSPTADRPGPAGDPWRDATVSADGQHFQSTPTQPIAEGDGFHCSDLLTSAGVVDSTIAAVQAQGLATMKTWLAAWRPTGRTPARAVAAEARARAPVAGVRARERREAPGTEAPSVKPVNVWFRDTPIF